MFNMENANANKNLKKKRQYFYYIYKITFLRGYPTGRYYLGKRTYFGISIDKDTYTGSGTFCFAYYKKYGKVSGDTYLKEILEINPSQEINKEREDYWVGTKYKDDPLCMNIVAGGAGSPDHEVNCYVQDQYKKNINQYELDGTFVKTWHGIRELCRELNINRSGIVSCITGKRPSAFGYQWKYYEGNTDNIESHFSVNPIIQYTREGEFIAEFGNTGEAHRATGIDIGTILETCQGKRISAGNYVWRFKEDDFSKYRTEKLKGSTKKGKHYFRELQQLDKDGNLIKLWDNVYAASTALNICGNSISKVANGTRKFAGGYKWIFTDQLLGKEVANA